MDMKQMMDGWTDGQTDRRIVPLLNASYTFGGGGITKQHKHNVMPMTHLPETRAGFQREFPVRVATKFALVSSASFQLWHPSTAL